MNSLDFRRDNRSIEAFSADIANFTNKEALWSEALRIDFGNCEKESCGIDNSGKLLVEIDSSIRNPDYKYKLNNGKELLVEIKTIPEWLNKFFTFKVTSLKNCLTKGAGVVVPKVEKYYIIGPTAIKTMLQYEHKIWRGFSSNDLSVRIGIEDVDKMIEQGNVMSKIWNNKALEFIMQNKEVLTADRGK